MEQVCFVLCKELDSPSFSSVSSHPERLLALFLSFLAQDTQPVLHGSFPKVSQGKQIWFSTVAAGGVQESSLNEWQKYKSLEKLWVIPTLILLLTHCAPLFYSAPDDAAHINR